MKKLFLTLAILAMLFSCSSVETSNDELTQVEPTLEEVTLEEDVTETQEVEELVEVEELETEQL